MEIKLRKFELEDAPQFLEAVKESIDHLSPWFAWCSGSYSIKEAETWAASADDDWQNNIEYRVLIEEVPTGQILGSVGINQITDLHKTGNLGYWVRKSAIKKGVCSTAAKEFVATAFKEIGLQRVEITIHPDNTASNAVAKNIGSVFEGTFRNKIRFHGRPTVANCYSLIPSDLGL